MSTRCNIHVSEHGLVGGDRETPVQLYHHCDGYPTHMLPLFKQAFEQFVERAKAGYEWEGGRSGKAAGMIIATEVGQFEPESDNILHGDIEYFYHIQVQNKTGGSMAEKPCWFVTVYTTHGLSEEDNSAFWDSGEISLLRKIAGPLFVKIAAQRRVSIEKMAG